MAAVLCYCSRCLIAETLANWVSGSRGGAAFPVLFCIMPSSRLQFLLPVFSPQAPNGDQGLLRPRERKHKSIKRTVLN